jgi:hypothetical protein
LLVAVTCAFAVALLSGCGEPSLGVTSETYEPRIVLEGLLSPGVGASVRVTRNARVDERLFDVTLRDADVFLVAEESGIRYGPLVFRDAFFDHDDQYHYLGEDLTIEYGGTYSLEVRAEVDGRSLFASATTTVPQAGFRILSVSHERLAYRPEGDDGEIVDITMQIQRSPGAPLYLMTARPLQATADNFVYDNPFTDEKPEDLDLGDFNFEWEWLQNPPLTVGISTMDVFWFNLWFYTCYEIVVYAADENYARFIQTFEDVQEEDGNFHEPVFSVDGDGIGYFGSAIADTVYLEITR